MGAGRILATAIVLLIANTSPGLAKDMVAVTDDDKIVILSPNGSWKYLETKALNVRPKEADRLDKGSRVDYGIWVNGNKWTSRKEKYSSDHDMEYRHKDGDAYAMVIAERLEIPLGALKKIVLENAEREGKVTKLIRSEMRTVNGKEVLYLRFQATMQGVSFEYMLYIYTGQIGTVQVFTYTGANLISEYEKDFFDFLNGFVVGKAV
jgi:hypothetical protein